MPPLTPIETHYHGYRFRSRLEARWAVFFDVLGIPYEYEKEGYDLGEVGWYLPDFWLPHQRIWIEIKGNAPTSAEVAKCKALSLAARTHVILLVGPPECNRMHHGIRGGGTLFFFRTFVEYVEEFRIEEDDYAWEFGSIEQAMSYQENGGMVSIYDADDFAYLDGAELGFFFPKHKYVEACNAARSARFERGQR
jgi:hypothetical protein